MRAKIISLFLVLIIPFVFTGCWDRVEIDRRAFISTIAIDTGDDINQGKKLKKIKKDEPFEESMAKRLNVTYGYPDISELGPTKGATASEKKISTEAYSMEDSLSEATKKSSRNIHLGHTKILILSDTVLQYPDVVKEIMDYFSRNAYINRMMKIVITKGNAEKFQSFKPEMEKNFQTYISGIMENNDRNSSVLPMTLNEFISLIGENGNAIVPYVEMDKDKNELTLYGTAVIKNYKMIGVLNSIETSNLEILRGKAKGGNKVLYRDGHPVDYVIEGVQRKFDLKKLDKDNLELNINIRVEGAISGFTIQKNILQSKLIQEYETSFNNSLSEECEKIIQIFQEKYSVDPLKIKEYLEKFHPYKYKKIKSNWEDVFKKAKINVNVYTKIRRTGITS